MELKLVDENGNQYDLKSIVAVDMEYNSLEAQYNVSIAFHKSNAAFDHEIVKFFSSKNEHTALTVRYALNELIDALT